VPAFSLFFKVFLFFFVRVRLFRVVPALVLHFPLPLFCCGTIKPFLFFFFQFFFRVGFDSQADWVVCYPPLPRFFLWVGSFFLGVGASPCRPVFFFDFFFFSILQSVTGRNFAGLVSGFF